MRLLLRSSLAPLTGVFVATVFFVMPSAASAAPATTTETPAVIAASDPRLCYEGRIDRADTAAPLLAWQATRVAFAFEGTGFTLRFRAAAGQNFFDVQVDDQPPVVARVHVGDAADAESVMHFVYPHPLPAGAHRVTLFKRSEAAAGTVRFAGVALAAGGTLLASPPPPASRLRLEFFGDSITAGACNEDGGTDQWEDRATHNNARSYAAFTAAHFAAATRNIAVSGMGVSAGWVELRAAQVWDRVAADPAAPRADLAAWQPHVAFVNLGENDGSFTGAQQQPFPADFTARYVALVRAIGAAYPEAHVVLLRGGMSNGARNPDLIRAWDAAVAELKADDARIHPFVFTHWSGNHPRVADARQMADELIAWLAAQPWLPAGSAGFQPATGSAGRHGRLEACATSAAPGVTVFTELL